LYQVARKGIEILTGISLPPECEIGEGSQNPEKHPALVTGKQSNGKSRVKYLRKPD
jgi:hypothetical protein